MILYNKTYKFQHQTKNLPVQIFKLFLRDTWWHRLLCVYSELHTTATGMYVCRTNVDSNDRARQNIAKYTLYQSETASQHTHTPGRGWARGRKVRWFGAGVGHFSCESIFQNGAQKMYEGVWVCFYYVSVACAFRTWTSLSPCGGATTLAVFRVTRMTHCTRCCADNGLTFFF